MDTTRADELILGIDGCPSGWCCASMENNTMNVKLFPDIQDLFEYYPDPTIAWIDVPIGLGSLTIEGKMRSILPAGRHHSVFTPPVREAVYSESYAEAKEIHKRHTGKAFSIQSWNICPRIRETDTFLRNNPRIKYVIYESHPELCFFFLNHSRPLKYSKSAPKNLGIEVRLKILGRYMESVTAAFETACRRYKRQEVRQDDIVDSLCLMISADCAKRNGFQLLRNDPPVDDCNIPMNVAYWKP